MGSIATFLEGLLSKKLLAVVSGIVLNHQFSSNPQFQSLIDGGLIGIYVLIQGLIDHQSVKQAGAAAVAAAVSQIQGGALPPTPTVAVPASAPAK